MTTAVAPLPIAAAPMQAAVGDHVFTDREIAEIFAPIHARGDRLMGWFLGGHALLAVILGLRHGTWLATTLVGGVAIASFLASSRLFPGTFLTRCIAGVSLQTFCALHIYQLYGLAEMHFFFFTGFTMMIVYQDWAAMWPGALAIIGQHTIFAWLHNAGAPLHFFEVPQVTLGKLFFHFGIALMQVVICGYWAHLLREQTLAEAGQRQRLAEASRELARRLQQEQEDAAARRSLEAQVRQAQKLESLGVLAGGIAHDFNNLLVGILGNVSLARLETPTTADAQRSLDEIETAAQRAAELTRQMLAYAGKGKLAVQSLRLADVVRGLEPLLRSAVSKRADFRLHLDADGPRVGADLSQLRQVIVNLVTNASEALAEHGGQLDVTTRMLHVGEPFTAAGTGQTVGVGSWAVLEVHDTGSGIEPDTIERIFDPFYSTKFAGRGLGLPAVLGIVRGHDGALAVTSEPGRGTVVTVYLPVCASDAGEVREEPVRVSIPRTEPVAEAESTERPVVLLVDDEEVVRAVTGRMLQHLGAEVRPAADAAAALAALGETGGGVRLVLLDINLGGDDGRQLLRTIVARGLPVRVVLISGWGEGAEVEAARADGAAGFLQKPLSLDRLRALLHETGVLPVA